MAGVQIRVDDAPVLSALDELRARGEDPKPVLRSIGEYLLRSHEQRFSSQTDPDGNPWAPLSEAYRKTKKRNADKVLTLDGYLRRLVYQVDDQGLSFGSNRIYAAAQYFGSGNIPARRFLGLSSQDESYIADELADYLASTRGN